MEPVMYYDWEVKEMLKGYDILREQLAELIVRKAIRDEENNKLRAEVDRLKREVERLNKEHWDWYWMEV